MAEVTVQKMRSFLIVLLLVLLGSCQRNVKAQFEITNSASQPIDSVNITSFDHEKNSNFISLQPGQSQIYWFDMTNLPAVDGDYLLTYKDSTTKSIRFGYFTNGAPLEKLTKIIIKQDTVIFDQIFNEY